MTRFIASVKHEDFKGSVAADISDTKEIFKQFDFVICSSRGQLNEDTKIEGPHYD